ncbi:hypothetical protein PsorP6_002456 [Peronosclerospora sorghi]|uniref:Uncharacterized protein n=1 Tax=Peronosclerospora sorghi TaxID=230839 RepID=A0ACC0WUD6_9STRA|nr:hypothetical protein PsorP6_002456 [Peronosclerospora sorghi]
MRPDFKAPSRKVFSSKLLPSLRSSLDEWIEGHLNNERLFTIALDGWSSPGMRILHDVIEPGDKSATGKFLYEKIKPIIKKYKPEGGNEHSKIFGIVSNSASNVKLLKEFVKEDYPYVSTLPFYVHLLNLICAELVDVDEFAEKFSMAK